MNLLALIPWYWRWGAIALLALAAAGFGAVKMHEHDETEFDAFKVSVQLAGERQNRETAERIAAQKSVTEATRNDYETRLAAVRDHFTGWVPVGPGGGRVPTVSCPAAGSDAGPTDAVPVAEYRSLAASCAETTQQLVSLQKWVRDEARASKSPPTPKDPP